MTAEKCIHARVHGRVQRVAFRDYTRREALRLGLEGWVRNRSDGTVEVWAEGSTEQVDQLLVWLWIGSPFSQVAQVEYTEADALRMGGSFEIRSAT